MPTSIKWRNTAQSNAVLHTINCACKHMKNIVHATSTDTQRQRHYKLLHRRGTAVVCTRASSLACVLNIGIAGMHDELHRTIRFLAGMFAGCTHIVHATGASTHLCGCKCCCFVRSCCSVYARSWYLHCRHTTSALAPEYDAVAMHSD